MHLVNYITLSRVLLGPLFFLVYTEYQFFKIPFSSVPLYLFVLLTISELTDLFDGILARRYQQVSDLGKILDPMADSIFRFSVFLTFILPPVNLPVWILFIIFYRESMISALRSICALKGFALAARASGKIKAVVQGIASLAIIVLLFFYTRSAISLEQLQSYSFYIATGAALYTAFSGIEYLFANREYVAKALSPKP